MSGIIGNGLSGLLAAQRALQTTSNNIANANTPGYVRQRVNLAAVNGGDSAIQLGQGVRVAGVERVYDQLLADQLRDATAASGRATAFNDFAVRLDRLLGDPDQSITTALRQFFDAVDEVGRDPTSIASRQQLLLEGDALAARFAALDSRLAGLAGDLDARVTQSVQAINLATTGIAALNERISASGGNPAPELLDQRQELIRTLAAQVDVSVSPQADGSVAVYSRAGQALVTGGIARPLTVSQDALQGDRLRVGVEQSGGFLDLSGKIAGGYLGGLLAFRRDTLDSARAQLGQIALGLAVGFNGQHSAGVDLDGNLGGEFFAVGGPGVSPSSTNTGTASVAATIADPAAVAARDYELRYDGAAWLLYDRATAAVIPSTGTGTSADPLRAEGIAIVATGTAQAGDRFLVRPLANAAANLRVAVTDPAAIAAAAPLTAAGSSTNLGTGAIGTVGVGNPADPALLATVEIRFETAATWRLFDAGGTPLTAAQPYTSGGTIAFNGWSLQISGTPAAGDRFSVRSVGTGSGDNGNAVALSAVADRGFFRGGLQSLTDLGADLIGTVGAVAARARGDLTAQQTIVAQAELDVESIAGVNLEEEAAELLRFQQAYQAAAKVVAIGDELFQTLLAAVR